MDDSGNAEVGGSSSGQSNRLASMFEPPRDLLFNGNFEEAKAYAASQGKWLVRDKISIFALVIPATSFFFFFFFLNEPTLKLPFSHLDYYPYR